MSWQNHAFVVLLWPLTSLQNHLHSILTHILRTAFLRFLLVVVLVFVVQIRDQIIQAMRNFDP